MIHSSLSSTPACAHTHTHMHTDIHKLKQGPLFDTQSNQLCIPQPILV